jgi:hypothetical protein
MRELIFDALSHGLLPPGIGPRILFYLTPEEKATEK